MKQQVLVTPRSVGCLALEACRVDGAKQTKCDRGETRTSWRLTNILGFVLMLQQRDFSALYGDQTHTASVRRKWTPHCIWQHIIFHVVIWIKGLVLKSAWNQQIIFTLTIRPPNSIHKVSTILCHSRENCGTCVWCFWRRTRMRCVLFTSRGMQTHASCHAP